MTFGFPEEKIREKISMLDFLIAKGGERKPKNPAGFLASAIRGDYRLPSDFEKPKLPKRRVTENIPTPVVVPPPSLAQSEEFGKAWKHFKSLSPDDQSQIELLAVDSGNRFLVEIFRRNKDAGGKLWEEARNQLVASYLIGQGIAA